MESAHPKGEPRKVPPPAKNRVSILLDDEVLASSRCGFPASVARMYENVLRFHWLGARVACHTFPTVRFDVGKSVAENHRKTANNEAPCAEADRGPKRVSSKLPLQTNTARPKGLRQLSHAGVRRQQGPAPVSEEVVPVVGVVHHQTSLGVFLEVAQRRVFIPANCMTTPSQVFEVGEPVTIWVLARFAEQEGLNP